MPYAMVPIFTQTVGAGGATSITFNNIPSNYTDLKILFSARATPGATRWGMYYRFNSDSSTTYSYTSINGYDSGSYQSPRGSNATSAGEAVVDGDTATANTFSNNELYIPNYSASIFKQIVTDYFAENNSTSAWMNGMGASLWRNTASINSITIAPNSGNFVQNSTFTLYGIKNA